jgi:hypothetical protein
MEAQLYLLPCIPLRKYRVAGINPEFLTCFFEMTQHSWKPPDFIEVKTGWQRNIMRIGLFNKNAASIDESLVLVPKPLAGLCHGVPGEGHHYPLDLRDQLLGFVVRLFSDP